MLSRRNFLISVLSGLFALGISTEIFFRQKSNDSPSYDEGLEKILESLNETVSPEIKAVQLVDFFKFIESNHFWLLDKSISPIVFAREICTRFIVNSNLPNNLYSIADYVYIQAEEGCNPFARST